MCAVFFENSRHANFVEDKAKICRYTDVCSCRMMFSFSRIQSLSSLREFICILVVSSIDDASDKIDISRSF